MIHVESRFQQYWEITASDLDLDQAQSKALFQLLVQAYTESQRFYHTQQHIVARQRYCCRLLFKKL